VVSDNPVSLRMMGIYPKSLEIRVVDEKAKPQEHS
jgi:hypothetical protein